MHSKFRLFVGSVLLLVLPAFGQASEPTPAATTAVPVVEMDGSGTVSDGEVHNQFGDGVYAVALSDMATNGEKWTTVGFVLIVNNGTPPAVSDIGQWVLSERAMASLRLTAKLPLPASTSVRLDHVGLSGASLNSAAQVFLGSRPSFAQDTFKAFKAKSVGSVLQCSGTIRTIQCL